MFRKALFLSVVALAVGVAASVAMAGNDEVAPMTEATPMVEATAAVNVGNTICPAMDTPVENPSAFTVEFAGKIYNVCSEEAKEKFLSDPVAYIAKVEASMKAAAEAIPAE
jgi:YHS domain-containing protein